MRDLIVSVPDHCLSFYFDQVDRKMDDLARLSFKKETLFCSPEENYVNSV